MKNIIRIALLTAATALALAGTGCSSSEPAPPSTFVLLDGSKSTTADLKGKVTLVNFWATTCVSCVKEMPQLAATYDKFKSRGFETVAVAMSYDPPQLCGELCAITPITVQGGHRQHWRGGPRLGRHQNHTHHLHRQ